jgi:hypothetical protein
MNRTQIIVIAVGIVAILLVAGFYGGLLNVNLQSTTNNYGTGMSISTTSVYTPQVKAQEYEKGQTWLSAPTSTVAGVPISQEPFAKNKYIVAWDPNELSELITLHADFQYNFLPMGMGPNAIFGHVATVLLSCYNVKVTYVDTSGKETQIINTQSGVDTSGNLWDTNYVEIVKEHFPPDSRHLADQGYQFPGAVYAKAQGQGVAIGERVARDSTVDKMTFANSYYRVGFDFSDPSWYHHPSVVMPTDTYEFYMKGLRTGVLKVSYGVTFAYVQQDGLLGWHGTWHYGAVTNVLTDACYLASGAGDINILSTGYIPNSPLQASEQKEFQDATGKTSWGGWYTKYVFPESTDTFTSTIKIGVKTGWSGTALNPGDAGYGSPWTLAIYNGQGVQVSEIRIADNFNGVVPYTIPKHAFVAGGDNDWKLVLKNTLFNEAETTLFVVDSLSKIPSPVGVSVDKTSYIEGDPVTLTLSALANPSGTGQISFFWVDVKYASVSSTYHVTGFPKLLTATKKIGTNYTYIATYTFKLDNTTQIWSTGTVDAVYIRAHAIDSAGRAGVEGEINGLQVKQRVVQNNGSITLFGLTIDWIVFVIIIIIIVALVAIYAFTLYRQRQSGRKRR